MAFDGEHRIEDLERRLESRKGKPQERLRSSLSRRGTEDIRGDWGDAGDLDDFSPEPSRPRPFVKRFFFGSLVFFALAFAVAGFIYYRGLNVVSSNNIDISIAGPLSVGAGQELDFAVSVKNQNNVDLDSASLTIQYPDGTRNPDNISLPQNQTQDDLGPIPSGGVAAKKLRAVLFGAQGSDQQITAIVDYRIKNSNAIFEKQKTFDIAIDSVPVSVSVSSLSEVNSGQPVEFDVTLTSNSSTPIANLLLTADYGFGFSFKSSTPRPITGQNVWKVGTLDPGASMTFKILGTIDAQDGESRAFHFSIGTADPKNPSTIQIGFLSTVQTITVQKPFIGVTLALDGDQADTHIARPGKDIRVDLQWVNNLPAVVTGAKISVSLTGALLDRSAVTTDTGFYDSLANTISWDQNSNPELATLQPGATGHMSFDISSVPLRIDNISSFKQGEIDLSVNVSGTRTDDPNAQSSVIATVLKKVHFSTDLALAARVAYASGPFSNSGPIPPRADTTTTYTVIWDVTDTFNDVTGVQVTSSLPSYVKWLGNVSPSSENISYDPSTGQIVWAPGTLYAGTGFSTSPREVAFQVSFTPSLSQVGAAPTLIGAATVTGTDAFTSTALSQTKDALTARLGSDAASVSGSETVTR